MLRGGRNDHFQNAVSIPQDIGIPEAKNPIAFRFEPLVSFNVALVFGVLSAIDFNDQLSLVANEIDDETPDWCLSPEGQAVQSMCAQRPPKTVFGVGHVAA